MTASYTAGTVAVTAGSDIVTGTGTGWLTANISPGFLGLDSANGNPVPVLAVLSDTSARLVKPWRGTTASGQAYWLSYDTRDGQQTVNNAQRLAEYVARLSSTPLSALAGLTPAADSLPYFTGPSSAAVAPLTGLGRAIIEKTDAGGVLTELLVSPFMQTLLNDANAPEAWATLGALQTFAGLGSVRFPGGFHVQWGVGANVGTKSFPVAFGNACYGVVGSMVGTAADSAIVFQVAGWNLSSFVASQRFINATTVVPSTGEQFQYLAWGVTV